MKTMAQLLLALLLPLSPVQAGQEPPPLHLGELLRAALAHDGRVLAANAQLDVYRARFKEARWAWFPRLRLQGLFGGPVGERRLACNPDSDPGCTGLEVTEASKTGDFEFGKMSFALGGKLEGVLPIYTFGKIDAARRAAAAGVEAGSAGIRQARQQVALEVRRAYWAWLVASRSVEVLEDSQRKITSAEKKLLKMLDELNEEVTDRDLFKLRYYAAQLDTLLEQSRQGRAGILSALRFLTGIEQLGRGRELAWREIALPAEQPPELPRLLEQARRQRPELLMLAAGVEAGKAAVEVARARFWPDFFLAGYVQGSWSPVQDYITNPLLSPGLTNYDAALAVGFRIELDVPQKLAQLERARAELARVQAQANQAGQAITLQVERAWQAVRTARARWRVQRRALRAAKAWMRANLMSYGVGVFDTKDLLDSIAAHAKATIESSRVHHDLAVAMDELRLAVGEDLGQPPAEELQP